MNGKQWVGERALSFKSFSATPPITQVMLATDESGGTVYTAGVEGYSISVICPWATQQMANDLLAKAQGFRYQGFEASMAALPGSAERGDGVNISGVYGMLADRTIYFNPSMNSDISAPWEEEVNHEFQYRSPIKQDINRQVGQVQANLEVAVDSITQTIQGINGEIAQITVNINGITQRVQDAEGNISTLEQKVDSITLSVSNGSASSIISLTVGGVVVSSQQITFRGVVTFNALSSSGSTVINGDNITTGTISADRLDLTGAITFGDLSSAVANDINNAYTIASDAQTAVGRWTYSGSTYIDGTKIMTGTVSASTLEGGSVNLLNSNGSAVGVMSMTGASSSSYAIDLRSFGALRLTGQAGDVFIQSGVNISPYLHVTSDLIVGFADLRSNQSGTHSCGTVAYPWAGVYSATAAATTSDREQKTAITYDMAPYDALFDLLRPTPFQYKNGTSGRTHLGMIAQDVEAALEELGFTGTDFAGYVKGQDEDGKDLRLLRYEEFIPLCIDQIQKLKARVAELEGKVCST